MNIRPRDRRLSRGLSGTFGRLGIPKEQVLPQELKLVMNRLEDKNLSPMLDTGAGNAVISSPGWCVLVGWASNVQLLTRFQTLTYLFKMQFEEVVDVEMQFI